MTHLHGTPGRAAAILSPAGRCALAGENAEIGRSGAIVGAGEEMSGSQRFVISHGPSGRRPSYGGRARGSAPIFTVSSQVHIARYSSSRQSSHITSHLDAHLGGVPQAMEHAALR